MPGFVGFPELIFLGLVVLLIFGPKRLPEMGKSLGKGMREFKDSISGDNKDDDKVEVVTATTAPENVVVVPASTEVLNHGAAESAPEGKVSH
ncbi:MAG: twin-arginine translocase TatA/TatE family subunit [Thermoleophilia bacterium]|nr:twin-arginine translocase TatA/TatE family subunit [Thermoleophilia bacterium]